MQNIQTAYAEPRWDVNHVLSLCAGTVTILVVILVMSGVCLSPDDSISAASMSDVHDRLSALELRLQQQEDELMVVKAALADVLRRLPLPEEPVPSRRPPGKGRLRPVPHPH